MSEYSRYAIYYTPPEGAFARFGAEWLGWDIAAGREVAQPFHPEIDLAAVTATPRKYGFHATLKAPFRLADGVTQQDLRETAAATAVNLQPVMLESLRLTRIGSFLALTPERNNVPLHDLAFSLVEKLDHLRAPMTQAERARRRPEGLSKLQTDYLDRWGYPYVGDEFRFHMTLTGALTDEELERVEAVLRPLLGVIPVPFPIQSICIVGERRDGRFQKLARFQLGEPEGIWRAQSR
ncbi:DUF1045 domain-containing protein [Paracoccus albus]|uniref:DUF1045 domain-containing protein n=1 Tax=Paracoccus albus TaxID=3017784 RepID=UPI0022F0A92C|nr:DUF1045 domain-containing protein [Paracoccus albus]WBU59494.1 DUF1045 domain-containing protein [Paracoccus albus]